MAAQVEPEPAEELVPATKRDGGYVVQYSRAFLEALMQQPPGRGRDDSD